ncbi:MAG: hypothetical protein ACOZIN_13640 [Myxococcota bacterium]
MRILWLFLVAPAACGAPLEGSQLPFELFVSRATADLVGSFQVAIVSEGRSLSCVEVQTRCLNQQLPPSRLLSVTDEAGQARRALVFPVALQTGTVSTQDVVVRGIAPGKDFAVVIEALSKNDPPLLVGSSCNYQPEIVAGTNAKLIATITALSPPAHCDPRWTP